jgi:predicted class III extradiol MEMO1 family dioxygenase
MVAPAPQALLAKNDHKAVAAWYANEAAKLRQKAHEMEVMEEEYRQDPERGRQLMVHAPKADFVEACKTLATMYTNAAKQAEGLANLHQSLVR